MEEKFYTDEECDCQLDFVEFLWGEYEKLKEANENCKVKLEMIRRKLLELEELGTYNSKSAFDLLQEAVNESIAKAGASNGLQ